MQEVSPTKQKCRARRRSWLFVVVALVLIGAFMELGGAVAWSVRSGEVFTWGRAARQREQVRGSAGGGSISGAAQRQGEREQRVASHGAILHPYLGYVHDGESRSGMPAPTSSMGFFGLPPIRKRSEDRYIVGIVGGSVALMQGLYGEQRLRESLARSPKLAGRDIEIVPLALGGYKQPQQLLTVQLMLVLGGEFDCILNIDGFNEVALVNENVPIGVPGWFPRSWARLLDTQPTPDQLMRLGRISILMEDRVSCAGMADTMWWSPIAQFIWRWQDDKLSAQLASLRQEAERATPADNPAIQGPGTEGRTVEQSSDAMVLLWQRASRQLHGLCEANGIDYFHFLQPNQYVPDSKSMGAEELARAFDPEHAWRPFVVRGYPKLQTAGKQLQSEGVRFRDLTNIFAEHTEPLYTDTCCHFNRLGNEILADHLAAAVRSVLDLADVEIKRLRVPELLEIASPVVGAHLGVVGVDAGGGEHDLSGVGFGTRLTAVPAESLEIRSDGSIRALRRGESLLSVACRGMRAEVRVTAAWPDIFDAGDAIPAADNQIPRIHFDSGEVARGAQTLTVECSHMPAAPMRLLAVSLRPLPASPLSLDVGGPGIKVRPIVTEGATTRCLIDASAPAGQPLYVRFYSLDETLKVITAASSTVVITRD